MLCISQIESYFDSEKRTRYAAELREAIEDMRSMKSTLVWARDKLHYAVRAITVEHADLILRSPAKEGMIIRSERIYLGMEMVRNATKTAIGVYSRIMYRYLWLSWKLL